jgi:adenylate cyclase
VLPFTNMSGDPEQEYFADGVVEEVITALSRFRELFVIARNSSFTYKGRSIDVRQVGQELGVRYVLEGSVRRAGNRIRIAGQLISATDRAHVWADRFDGALEDVFDLQDRITESVVAAIVPTLQRAEIERARRKVTDSLDAYDHYLRGLEAIHAPTRAANENALQCFYAAIQNDPNFAVAYGAAATSLAWKKSNGWFEDSARESRLAAELGSDDSVALTWAAWALTFAAYDLASGTELIERALMLNQNTRMAWHVSGWIRTWIGEPEAALEHFARAERLSPLDPLTFNTHTGVAYAQFFRGRYDEASAWAQRALRERSRYYGALRIAAASYACAGRMEEAKTMISAMIQVDPSLRLSNLQERLGPYRPEPVSKLRDALRSAGLPE